jgi:peptidoglycan/LPS O-acetylase OafA/YrhL
MEHTKYITALNGLRGFAFLNVLIEHNFISIISTATGQPAVTLFFVLSGYLLSLQLYSKLMNSDSMGLPSYFIRRFFRIYPLYLLALLFDLCIRRIDFDLFIKLVVLNDIYKQYWTIFEETKAYLLIPLFVWLLYIIKSTLAKTIVISTSIALFVIWYLVFTFSPYQQSLSYFHTDYITYLAKNVGFLYFLPMFCIGVFGGITNYHLSRSNITLSNSGFTCLLLAMSHVLFLACLGIYALIIWKLPVFNFDRDNLNIFFALGYTALCILLSQEGENFFKSLMESKVFQFFGDISYPGYLFHLSLNYLFVNYIGLQPVDNIILFTIITIPSILLLSYFLHITIENFFINVSKTLCVSSNKPVEEIKADYGTINVNDTTTESLLNTTINKA